MAEKRWISIKVVAVDNVNITAALQSSDLTDLLSATSKTTVNKS